MTTLASSAKPAPPLADKKALTAGAARAIMAAAEAEAARVSCKMCIAILDDGGHLNHFVRMDGTHIGSIEVAIAKARSALLYNRPTKAFSDAYAAGSTALPTLPGIVPFEGGVPLVHQDRTIGAIGVSGGSPQLDGQVAMAGAATLI